MTNEHEQRLHELLCAYVLGEVDADQRAEIERELAGSPELRAERERIEATIGLVRDAMAPAETLSPQATADVLSAARGRQRRSWYARPALIAAGVAALVASSIAILRSSERRPARDELANYSPPPSRDSGRAKEQADNAPAESKVAVGGTEGSIGVGKDELLANAQSAERSKARDQKRDGQLPADGSVTDAVEKNVYRYELFGQAEAPAAPPATAAGEADTATKLFAAESASSASGVVVSSRDTSSPFANDVHQRKVEDALPGEGIGVGGGAHHGVGRPAPFVGRKLGENVAASNSVRSPRPEELALRSLGYAGPDSLDGAVRTGLEANQPEVRERFQGLGYAGSEPEGGVTVGSGEFFLGRGAASSKDDFRQMTAEERARWLDLECHRIVEGCRPRPNERPRDMYFRFWGDNPFEIAALDAQSTFSVDVDTASYALARRYINEGHLPEKAQVRTEEFINYFKPEVAAPREGTFAIHTDLTPSRFSNDAQRSMLRVVVRGREVSKNERKPLALTFVIDVSGSMREQNRLEMVKHALRLLVSQLDGNDSIAIVAFSTDARMILPTTSAANRGLIESALYPLQPDGSTNSQAGLRMGYESALASLRENATNRVVFLSDGVATVGEKDPNTLSEEVRSIREKGVYLNTIGVGMNNHNDALLEQLADKGDGVCNYIDTPAEARRVLVDDFTGAFEPIARDVKVQVEFDQAQVYRYRLLGYENRAIADRDFRNDAVDAGEIGAGHAVTALYEIERTNQASEKPLATVRVRWKAPRVASRNLAAAKLGESHANADEAQLAQSGAAGGGEIKNGEAKKAKEPVLGPGGVPRGLPYEKDSMSPVPEGDHATEIAQPVFASQTTSFEGAGAGYRRAAIVAQFAEFLRRSSHARGDSFDELVAEAQKLDREAEDKDFHELVGLVQGARNLILSNLPSCDELCQTIDAVRRNQILRAEQERLSNEVDANFLKQLEQQNAELELRIRELLRRRLEQPPK